MNKIIFFLLVFLIISCNPNYKKSDFLGTWDPVSTMDISYGKEELVKGENHTIEFRLDSVIVDGNDMYTWEIKGDSIFIDGDDPVYIKELTPSRLTIESISIIAAVRMEFKKRK